MLEEVRDLVDQVGREHDGARVLGVVLEQPVVEDVPRDGVEAEVRFVEERQLGARREADDDADGRELAARELLDTTLERQPEVGDEALGELCVPVLEEPRGGREDVRRREVFGIALRLGDEAELAQHVGVLGGHTTEDLELSAVREDLPVSSCMMVVLPAPLRPSRP